MPSLGYVYLLSLARSAYAVPHSDGGFLLEEAPWSSFATYGFIADPPSKYGVPRNGLLFMQNQAGDVAYDSSSLLQTGVSSVKLNATAVGVSVASAAGKIDAKVDAKQKLEPKTWWAITISTALVVKTLCMMSNVIFQMSPFPGVKEFYVNGDTGQADAATYMSIFFGGFQWCFYGVYAYIVTEKAGFLVLVYSNFLGPILGSGYVFGFWSNCQDGSAIQRLYNYMGIATTLFLMQILVMCTEPCQKALFFSGFISSVCSVMVSLSMLATVPKVFETKCSSSINVTVTIVGVVSAMLWLTCGCILKDKWIMVPNSIGLVILVFTLSLTVRYPQDEECARALLAACNEVRELEVGEAAVMIRTALDSVPEYGTCSERRSVLGKPFVVYSGDTGGTW